MKAKDIMTTRVVSVPPDFPAREIARILLVEGVSAVPVVDGDGVPVGIVSEGDLIKRDDDAREARRDWWLSLAAAAPAADLLAGLGEQGLTARDLMIAPVITVEDDTDATAIARLLVAYRIKRVPVLHKGKMVGIVSRADLLRVLAAEAPLAAQPPQESLLSRAIAGIDGHFGHTRHGEAKPDRSPESAWPLSAGNFRSLTEEHRHHEVEHRDEAHRAEIAARMGRLSELGATHVTEAAWQSLMAKAREAARAGLTEFLLLRFPSELCSDGGRAINVTEAGWPATLRGEAAEIYLRWERDLRPEGFHLTAQVLDFPGGFPGDIGLILNWAA